MRGFGMSRRSIRASASEELDYILQTARTGGCPTARGSLSAQRCHIAFPSMLGSGNMWLAMTQYFCSNFTFFFMLSWLFPYLKKTYTSTP